MKNLTKCLKLFADETRLRILHLLSYEALTVSDLQKILSLRQSSVSSHLAKLKEKDLIFLRTEGNSNRYLKIDKLNEPYSSAWEFISNKTKKDKLFLDDKKALNELRKKDGQNWVEHVAGNLKEEYAPGRNWETLGTAFLNLIDFGDCVDIGSGDGAMMPIIVPQCKSLICIDSSKSMTKAANSFVKKQGYTTVECKQANAEELPLKDNSCDTVFFLQSLQYLKKPEQAIKEAIRILKKEGNLIIATLEKHNFVESERYGHQQKGFTEQQLLKYCKEMTGHSVSTLPPESCSPRFKSLVFYAKKK